MLKDSLARIAENLSFTREELANFYDGITHTLAPEERQGLDGILITLDAAKRALEHLAQEVACPQKKSNAWLFERFDQGSCKHSFIMPFDEIERWAVEAASQGFEELKLNERGATLLNLSGEQKRLALLEAFDNVKGLHKYKKTEVFYAAS